MRKNLPIEVKFFRRNAGDGVPYDRVLSNNDDESRDTRPRVSGSSNIVRSDTPGGVSLQRYLSFIVVCSHIIIAKPRPTASE